MHLRRANPDDMPAVARLFRETRTACLPYLPDLHTPQEDAGYFAGVVLRDCAVWLAEDDGLLGFIAFRPGWVDHLYIRPSAHGRGIGTALLERATAAREPLALWAFQRNARALRFYLARGWRAVEHTDGAGNEEREPDTRLVWTDAPVEPLRLETPSPANVPDFVATMLAGWSPSSDRDVTESNLAALRADEATFLHALNGGEGTITLDDGSVVPRLPGRVFWLWDGAFCGNINFRHVPGTEDLPAHVSGHVGYHVVPWKRRRGYATAALAMILPYAHAVGLSRVLLTCDDDNHLSRRVIEANGGVPAGTAPNARRTDSVKLQFWVPTRP